MESLKELKPRRIRVFKWNDKLLPPSAINQEEEGRCWIFLLQINKRFIGKIPGHNKDEQGISEKIICSYTNPSCSSSSRRNREAKAIFRTMFTQMMHEYFPEAPQTRRLLRGIIDYLSFNFRFDAQTLLRPNGPMIVFVVEVDGTWTVEYDQHDLETNTVVDPSNLFPPDYLPAKSSDCLRRKGTASFYRPNDEEVILITLQDHLRVKPISPTTKLAEEEPGGLVEVKPRPALLKVHARDIESECPICLEKLYSGTDVIKTLCSHTFHVECISKWLSRADSCPACRFGPLAPLPSWPPPSCNYSRIMSCFCRETVIESRIGMGQTVQDECDYCGETIVARRNYSAMIIDYKCPCGDSRPFVFLEGPGNGTGFGEEIRFKYPCGKRLKVLCTEDGEGFVLRRRMGRQRLL